MPIKPSSPDFPFGSHSANPVLVSDSSPKARSSGSRAEPQAVQAVRVVFPGRALQPQRRPAVVRPRGVGWAGACSTDLEQEVQVV